jgi:hypothetical protein
MERVRPSGGIYLGNSYKLAWFAEQAEVPQSTHTQLALLFNYRLVGDLGPREHRPLKPSACVAVLPRFL